MVAAICESQDGILLEQEILITFNIQAKGV